MREILTTDERRTPLQLGNRVSWFDLCPSSRDRCDAEEAGDEKERVQGGALEAHVREAKRGVCERGKVEGRGGGGGVGRRRERRSRLTHTLSFLPWSG